MLEHVVSGSNILSVTDQMLEHLVSGSNILSVTEKVGTSCHRLTHVSGTKDVETLLGDSNIFSDLKHVATFSVAQTCSVTGRYCNNSSLAQQKSMTKQYRGVFSRWRIFFSVRLHMSPRVHTLFIGAEYFPTAHGLGK